MITSVEQLASSLRNAFYIANSGRPGPVVFDTCKNALEDSSENWDMRESLSNYNPYPRMNAKRADEIINAMLSAKKPLVLAGGGTIDASKELRAFVEKYDLYTTLTFMGTGAIPHDSDQFLGMPGMHGTAAANYALRECDFLLTIGCRLDDRVANEDFVSGKVHAHVDIDPSEIKQAHFNENSSLLTCHDSIDKNYFDDIISSTSFAHSQRQTILRGRVTDTLTGQPVDSIICFKLFERKTSRFHSARIVTQ